ncbi:MATE family efflux transporter [Thermoanaerobacter siderophilus]|uniref:Probable multidrug resistance protein NorM n=1 Tax=Thermoanaerobacter siderophilus SR4 TaxID=880478 RepID=I8R2E3_9THEO|nr:MATE family efflux transporter [Thermoanaerobacter siderophilus]EIV99554.1 putative efflux protein, MATE family [Thermoanaerobacter siderophilus SR4]HHW57202.1 MATE family efflux transporter [Clostridia bacterium]
MLLKKEVSVLAIPVVVEQTFIILASVINAIMASRLSKQVISAIGMADSLNNILVNIFSGLAIGGTVVIAQYIGQNNRKSANRVLKQVLYFGILVSVLVTILVWLFRYQIIALLYKSAESKVLNNLMIYLQITILNYPLIAIQLIALGALRGSGDTKTPMKINIIINISNVIFSYIFMYGVKTVGLDSMGIKGAALGITLSRIIGVLAILTELTNPKHKVFLNRIIKYNPDWKILNAVFTVGIPASIESLLFTSGKLIVQILVVGLGTASIAADSIFNSILSIFNIPGNALSAAATILVGQHMGRQEIGEAKKYIMYTTKVAAVILGILGAISYPFAHNIASFYTSDETVIKIASDLIKLNSVCILLWPPSFIFPAGLKGSGDSKYTMVISTITMWLFRIGLAYIFGIVLKLGLIGVWMGRYADWGVRGILYFIRLHGNKWNKILVKSEGV